ncbi:MAG TPA: ROK family protein [Candidatus Poseidoniales archaeon]|nr:ROK family protein [Candidatus Poseidoniales archaeon]
MLRLGIDIGGTSIKGALVGNVVGHPVTDVMRVEAEAPYGPEVGIAAIEEIGNKIGWTPSIGIGFPGVVSGTTVRTAPNLGDEWEGFDFAELIADSDAVEEVTLINDADAAACAEHEFGAGEEEEGTILMITIGTGLGTAIIRNGVLVPNLELGLIRWDAELAVEHFASSRVKDEEDLDWGEWSSRFQSVLEHYEMLLSPDIIILGGGFIHTSRHWWDSLTTQADLRKASLGNDAGIVGAALS